MNRDHSDSIVEMSDVVLINDATVYDQNSPDWTHSFLRLITLNICCGRYGNLNVSLQTMHQMRVNLGIITETKIDKDMYTRDCCSYGSLVLLHLQCFGSFSTLCFKESKTLAVSQITLMIDES
jgi:hypothetical protein